jgi:hypothetical protein
LLPVEEMPPAPRMGRNLAFVKDNSGNLIELSAPRS